MSIANLSNSVAAPLAQAPAGSVASQASLAVFKKAVDLQAQSAIQLVDAIQTPQRNPPPSIGSLFSASA